MSNSILIVDDERGIRETLRGVLEDEGFEVETVESGEACLKAVETKTFACILLDIWLGNGIDGLETLKQLGESGNEAAVVMISGHGNIETAVKSTKLGAFDFIEKPFHVRDLNQKIMKHLGFAAIPDEPKTEPKKSSAPIKRSPTSLLSTMDGSVLSI